MSYFDMKRIGGLVLALFVSMNLFSAYAAKTEVPTSLPGIKVITEDQAIEHLFTNQCMKHKTCVFIDPRKSKDWKRGIIKGSILYTFKSDKDFDEKDFLDALHKRGYNQIKSLNDLKSLTIISGCNGKFCPRSGALLTFLKEKLGGGEFLWVREEGVPGILKKRR